VPSDLAPDVAAHRAWLYDLVTLPRGGTLVDLGCGDGRDLLAMAARHRDDGLRFLGLDVSAKGIANATAAADAVGDARVAFARAALGGGLPLADGTVDVAYSHNLLECLADPDAFAREVARVLRPGGQVVVAHWDWDTQLFDVADRATARRLLHAFADWRQPWMEHADGWMGRRLHGVFTATGRFRGAVHAHTLTNTIYAAPWYGHARAQDLARLVAHGLVTAEDHARFAADLERAVASGRYFYALTSFVYVGQRVG
jgi:SAM-dependent methyltransferase